MSIITRKAIGIVLVVVVVAALVGSGFMWGFRYGERFPQTLLVRGVANIDSQVTQTTDFSPFWQVWKIIDDNYLRNKDVIGQEKVYGAIQGLVNSLEDPYSNFFPPQESKRFQEDIQGNFSGIGAEIGIRKGQLIVISPLKKSPAERAGLKPGDKILLVNSSSTEGLSIDQAVDMIRGPEHTKVVLKVFRDEWDEPKDITIVRENIEIPTTDFEMKEGGIAYIALYGFNANAPALFEEAAREAVEKGAKGVVLDLRNNPGGYLEVAVHLAGMFLQKGTLVVSEASRIAPTEELRAQGNVILGHLPVVILVNGGSASASEILAGALRDQKKIKLIGEETYGKGTVQQVIPLVGNSSIKLTVAHWVLPSGQILDGKGLVPDIEVKTTDENTKDGKDPQREKAMEVMRGLLAN